ncbi:MAG: 30S ribosomal protein S17 [Candidatus Omnitrophica bacterium]|nr:30S ribosomal protein S17 [Candidatus Omnitrophota bacterium]
MPTNVRRKRKERIGVVTSDSMDKTITVQVGRIFNHPVYDKAIKMQAKFKAHDEKEVAKVGDTVRIEETRPLSKTKRWRLVEIIKKRQAEAGETR